MKKLRKILISLLLFVVGSVCFAKTMVADLGDVRIYSLGNGYFEVESDRVNQCFALTFRESGGWVEVACSSKVKKIASDGIGEAVKYVVKSYLGGNSIAADIASKLASWASGKGIDYLCE